MCVCVCVCVCVCSVCEREYESACVSEYILLVSVYILLVSVYIGVYIFNVHIYYSQYICMCVSFIPFTNSVWYLFCVIKYSVDNFVFVCKQ